MKKFAFFSLVLLMAYMPLTNAEGMKAFIALDSGSESKMEFAITFTENFCRESPDSRFELLAGGAGITIFSKSRSPFKDRMKALMSSCQHVNYFACKETVDKMVAAGGEHTPDFFPNVQIASCKAHFKKLTDDGYYEISTDDA